MSEAKKGLKEGSPIWVESYMSPKEYKETHKKCPNTVLTSVQVPYIKEKYEGGRWLAS